MSRVDSDLLKNRVPFMGPEVMKGHLDADEIGNAFGHDAIEQIADKLTSQDVWEDKKTELLQALLDSVALESTVVRVVQHESLLLSLNGFVGSKLAEQRTLLAQVLGAVASLPQGKEAMVACGSLYTLHKLLGDGSERVRVQAGEAVRVFVDTAAGCAALEADEDFRLRTLVDALYDENDALAYAMLRTVGHLTRKDSVVEAMLNLDLVDAVMQFMTPAGKDEAHLTPYTRLAASQCLLNLAVHPDGKEAMVAADVLAVLSTQLFHPLSSLAETLHSSHTQVRQNLAGIFMLVATCLSGKKAILANGIEGLLSCVLDEQQDISSNAITALKLTMELPAAKQALLVQLKEQSMEEAVKPLLGLR